MFPKEDSDGVTMEWYEFYDPVRSKRGVSFVYHDGTYPDHHEDWKETVEDPNAIAASGSLTTTMGRNAFDETKQQEVGRFLRDYYKAVLYDPQSGITITD